LQSFVLTDFCCETVSNFINFAETNGCRAKFVIFVPELSNLMKKNKYRVLVFGKTALPVWLAIITFGMTEFFSHFPEITEAVYSQALYTPVAYCLSFVSRWFPFSLDDLFYGLLILFAATILLMTAFRKIKFSRFLILLIQTLSLCYVLFYWFWGFNYYRNGINDRLSIVKTKPDTSQFVRVFENLIAETNASYCGFDSISKPEIETLVESSYQKNASFLKIDYPLGKRNPKPITFSSFFAKASIAGYYGPFFSEVHVNDSLLLIEYPQVLAHEFAHQFGITSEAEANFYSWLVCTSSKSRQLKYSANINMINYFLSQGRHLHSLRDLVHRIDKPVIEDIRKVQKHWESMRNEKIDQAAGKVNDAYLKTNKVKSGIQDYFGVVQFVMDFETDSAAQKRVFSRSVQ
jgi:hypothetical protein